MEIGEKDLSKLLKEMAVQDREQNRSQSVCNSSIARNRKRFGLTDAKTKFYWEEMLEAVQVIHGEGVVHSDLKPANFLIVGGTLKLIDFGIGIYILTSGNRFFTSLSLFHIIVLIIYIYIIQRRRWLMTKRMSQRTT